MSYKGAGGFRTPVMQRALWLRGMLRSTLKATFSTGLHMLHYAVVFFVIALIAAAFGFGGIAASAVGIGKILFIVFLILAIASFIYGLVRKP